MKTPATTALNRIDAFEAGEVDPAEFDHAAHVRLACDYLATTGLPATLVRYCDALRRLTRRLGVPGKYHETVTCFLLLTIAERRAADPDRSWRQFREANQDLFTDVRGLLSAWYSPERLASPLARRQFLLPDRAPARPSRDQGTTMRYSPPAKSTA